MGHLRVALKGKQLIRYLGIEDDDVSLREAARPLSRPPALDPRYEPHCSRSEAHIPNIFQNLPEGWLWGTAHSSICIQEGQPLIGFAFFHFTVEQLRPFGRSFGRFCSPFELLYCTFGECWIAMQIVCVED